MTTLKKRINITADADIERALIVAARRDDVPTATKAAELLRIGLEFEEDFALGTVANDRAKNKIKYVSHASAWKKL